jgi:5-methylcytosine-specific restriction protein A
VERGYDAAWKRVRLEHLAMEPLCRHCRPHATPATQVDHIIDIADDPDLRLVHTNLQSLCHTHHSKKTKLKQLAQRRGYLWNV